MSCSFCGCYFQIDRSRCQEDWNADWWISLQAVRVKSGSELKAGFLFFCFFCLGNSHSASSAVQQVCWRNSSSLLVLKIAEVLCRSVVLATAHTYARSSWTDCWLLGGLSSHRCCLICPSLFKWSERCIFFPTYSHTHTHTTLQLANTKRSSALLRGLVMINQLHWLSLLVWFGEKGENLPNHQILVCVSEENRAKGQKYYLNLQLWFFFPLWRIWN